MKEQSKPHPNSRNPVGRRIPDHSLGTYHHRVKIKYTYVFLVIYRSSANFVGFRVSVE
jgi:hypothetical protein